MPEFKIHPAKYKPIYFCFFLSGATGLIYQVIWARQLGLVFGNTMYAISIVLATFMAGLGIGSYLANKLLEWYPHPLRIYAILEVGIGLWVLLVPSLLEWTQYLHFLIHPLFEFSTLLDTLLHFGLSSLVLLVPTILMGGTLPALTTCCTSERQDLGGKLSILYALNTLGAVTGTWWVGFYALPWLGIILTNFTAALINLLIGLFFIFSIKPDDLPIYKAPSHPLPPSNKISYFLLIGMVAAGFSAMIYEIAWTRMLVMVLGSSTYAFSCILMAFLLGITLGSFIFNLLSRKFTLGLRGFCLVEILIGIFSLVSLPTFSLLPRTYIILFNALPTQISWAIQGLRFLIPVLIMVIPATFMGLAFPLAGALYSEETGEITRCVCKVYGANTLGNVCGAIFTGFFLLSVLGAQRTLKLAIILNLLLGVIGLLLKRFRFNPLLIGIVAFIMGLTIIQPRWDKYLMDSGVAIYTDRMSAEKSFEDRLYQSEMLFFKEGINAIVTVYQKSDGNRFLRINGKADASTIAIDMSTQLLLGHIPVILHPGPQNALVIGLGGGITANTVAQFDFIRQVDCVEIEPAVVEAVHYFNHYNQNILQNGKIDLIVDDGRSYLRKTDRSYDLIISEPSNPWIKGIGNLFTVEYYRLCRKSLNSRGIMCQWVQIYELSPEIFKMIVNSFRQVFPYCQLWFNPPGNAFIIGSKQPIIYDLESVDKKLDFVKLQNKVNRVGLIMDSALSFLAYFELNNEEITEFTKGADLNSDNYPKLEFLAPYNLTMNTIIPNYKLIQSYKKHILPPNIRLNNKKIFPDGYYYGLSKVYLEAGLSRQILQYIHLAYYYINLALKTNGRDERYYIVRGRINTVREAFEEAYADFSRSLELDSKNYETYQALAYLFEKQKKWEKAQTYYQQALKLEPQNEQLRSAHENFLDSWKESRLSPDKDLTIPKEL